MNNNDLEHPLAHHLNQLPLALNFRIPTHSVGRGRLGLV